MSPWSFVAAVKDMQVVLLVGPDDGTEMMIGVARTKAGRLGEGAPLWIVNEEHGAGAALAIFAGGGVPVVDKEEPVLEVDRLRPLPAIVEHFEFSGFTEG